MALERPPPATAPPTPPPQTRPPAATNWSRLVRRKVFRRLADRRLRRHLLLVLVTLVAVGLLAATKGLIGYYVFAQKTTRFEVALAVVAVLAAVFALGERRVASALEARFNRNTKKHREALVALRDELAEMTDRAQLEQRLVARFDELFGTVGTLLFVDDGRAYAITAHTAPTPPPAIARDDPLVVKLRDAHAPVNPADAGSPLTAPLVWPLRARGHLIGLLASGEHDYIESFDATEIEAVEALADATAANLALLDPALLAQFAPRTPHNLPPQLASFVGRERELRECRQLLQQARLLTLTGFGGAGKSRLARQLAEELLPAFPAGVWWVELAAVVDDAHVPSAVAAAIGVPETQGMALTGQLAQRFGDRAVLLVLDTCEHLRAGCADLASGLVRDCRNLAVLATSQSPLGVPGERDYPLPTLTLAAGDGAADSQASAESEAVRLFVDRARLALPDFAPGAADLAAIADIVARLDGIPLAIELAAARVKFLSLATIRDRLDDCFRVLAGGDRAIARHETMRASIQWSHDHLTAEEQQLLRRLAVFAGGFTLAAAAKVAADDDDALAILDPVGRLVEKSLLQVARDSDGEPRYRMLEPMRQFAREMLAASGEEQAVRSHHADYYVAVAERAGSALRGKDAAGALATLDAEFDNLMTAHGWCSRTADTGAADLRLAHALELYWLDRGLLTRGSELAREALRHPGAAAASRLRAETLLGAARHAYLRGDIAATRPWLAECIALARALPADDLACRALALSGLASQREGESAAGRRELDLALAMARGGSETSVLREALDDLGEFFRSAGALAEAAAALEESLALARAADDTEALHLGLRDVARLAVERRDLDRASALLREAIDLALATGARFDGENDLEVAGELAAARAEWFQAARFAGAADAAAAAMGSARGTRDDAITAADAAAPRDALGGAEYAAAYAEGQRLRLSDALGEARDWLARPAPRPPPAAV